MLIVALGAALFIADAVNPHLIFIASLRTRVVLDVIVMLVVAGAFIDLNHIQVPHGSAPSRITQ